MLPGGRLSMLLLLRHPSECQSESVLTGDGGRQLRPRGRQRSSLEPDIGLKTMENDIRSISEETFIR